jgi:hypothetical protein
MKQIISPWYTYDISCNSTLYVNKPAFLFYGKTGTMTDNPHQFTHDAWEANADVWDTRMGDEGNDFFNI